MLSVLCNMPLNYCNSRVKTREHRTPPSSLVFHTHVFSIYGMRAVISSTHHRYFSECISGNNFSDYNKRIQDWRDDRSPRVVRAYSMHQMDRWLVGQVTCWLSASRLADRLTDWLADRLAGWLSMWLTWFRCDWQAALLAKTIAHIAWLIIWLTYVFVYNYIK